MMFYFGIVKQEATSYLAKSTCIRKKDSECGRWDILFLSREISHMRSLV
jgi:hypothetical protein